MSVGVRCTRTKGARAFRDVNFCFRFFPPNTADATARRFATAADEFAAGEATIVSMKIFADGSMLLYEIASAWTLVI